uniref:ORF7 protein n=1 Tax=Bat Coronavirus MaJX20 TaxID=3018845 RepID=A0AA49IDK6_9NIDO|nr:ORF7 protein [Bat Coronavirus MaJX20]
MFPEVNFDALVIYVWLLSSSLYIFMYQWWWTWFSTGVLPGDTWFVMLLFAMFCLPAFCDMASPGFLDWWYDGAQMIHNNIMIWLLSDMRPLGFLYWILVLLGLVLYTTVVQ